MLKYLRAPPKCSIIRRSQRLESRLHDAVFAGRCDVGTTRFKHYIQGLFTASRYVEPSNLVQVSTKANQLLYQSSKRAHLRRVYQHGRDQEPGDQRTHRLPFSRDKWRRLSIRLRPLQDLPLPESRRRCIKVNLVCGPGCFTACQGSLSSYFYSFI